MRTSSRAVSVVLFDEVELIDVASVLSVLTSAGRQWNFRPFKVKTVATRAGLVETRSQVRLEATHRVDDVSDTEILVVPGGYGARRALDDPALVDFLSRTKAKAERFLALGNGVLLLGKAGLLGNRDVAARGDAAALLGSLEPTARIDEVAPFRESDGVITAATPLAGVDASLALVEKILGKKQAVNVAFQLGAAFTSTDVDVGLLERK